MSASNIDLNAPTIAPPTHLDPKVAQESPKAPEGLVVDQGRLDAMEKREKAIRTESRRLQALKAEIEAAKAPKPKTEAELREELRSQFLQDPTQFGLSYEDISNKYLTQPTPEEQQLSSLRSQIESERAEREKLAKGIEENQSKAYKQAVAQISSQVAQLVANNDAYEAIQLESAQPAVVQLIEDTYREEGIILDVEEAAKAIEEVIVDKARSYAKLKKLQANPETAADPLAPAPEQIQQNPSKKRKSLPFQVEAKPTLTNAMSQSPALSQADRKARIIAQYSQKLT